MPGPLVGIRIIEIAGIGPAPFATMILSDLGAEVIRVDRAGSVRPIPHGGKNLDLTNRGRRSIGVDLKHPDGAATLLDLVEHADVLIEGFRPGVAERLGFGPEVCCERNPRLIYGRMTGWGQVGPLAHAAGHDINYISIAGALAHFGRAGEKPTPPINMMGDFGGGSMMLVVGVLAALLERANSGRGQVIDAAMVDGAASLMTMIWGMRAMGVWEGDRGENLIDTGAPFYDTYETSDGEFISIGSLEPQFFAELASRLGLDAELPATQNDRAEWPAMRSRFAELFRSKSREEWTELLEGTDVCFAPVLTMDEAPDHPHMRERGTFVEVDGVLQPGPAPRFSRSQGEVQSPPPWPGQHTDAALRDWGIAEEVIAQRRASGALS
ncbi:MAG: CaiB/BaiF CoA-transferase family protein [Acidimicrobiia bacterium]